MQGIRYLQSWEEPAQISCQVLGSQEWLKPQDT